MSYDPASPGTSPGPLASNDRESAIDAGADSVQRVGGTPPPAEPPFAEPPRLPWTPSVAEAASAAIAPSGMPPATVPDVTAPAGEFAATGARETHASPPVYEPYPTLDYSGFEDPFVDVPASLELAYTTADLGLSADAFDRTIPYEGVARRRRTSAGSRLRRVGRELAETVILAVLIFFAVKAVVQNFRVEGASMEPSLQSEEYLLVNKAIYFRVDMDKVHQFLPFIPNDNGQKKHLFRAPRRGDVVVFRFPMDPSRDFIKRVIGVPGDTVEVKDEKVYINGAPLVEPYILATPNYTYGPKTVPAGAYFVLGDNRRNSYDSHAWGSSCPAQQQCDFVPEENIIGQAWLQYWPLDAFGFVNNKIIKPHVP
jgi:signal peptidase I